MILLGKGLKGEMPLLFAAERGLEAIVEVLLVGSERKDDLTDGDGYTPLLHGRGIKRLLENGAQPDSKDDKEQTPLSCEGQRYDFRAGLQSVRLTREAAKTKSALTKDKP
jgi:hypothetical protein